MAEQNYQVNTKAEEEVKAIMQHLEQQDEAMIDILRRTGQQHLSMINVFAAIRSNDDRNPRPGVSPQISQQTTVHRHLSRRAPAA